MGNDIETSEPLWFAFVFPLFEITQCEDIAFSE